MSRAMIRVSPPMVKQAPERSASPGRPSLTLLPPAGTPEIVRARGGEVDALLVVVPESAAAPSLESLPESLRWRDLLAREKPRASTVRTTSLANRRQTLAVLGCLGPKASAFERLALAGLMIKEAAARAPQTIGLQTAGFPSNAHRRAAAEA